MEGARKAVPVLAMLFQSPEELRSRANKIAAGLRKALGKEKVDVVKDSSKAGGGSLPEMDFPTFAVSLKPSGISVNELESRLRNRPTPVIARIKDQALLLDARTIRNQEIGEVVRAVSSSLAEE
jgi:L-seryl-tRNA(Ser) seleniumtransferase